MLSLCQDICYEILVFGFHADQYAAVKVQGRFLLRDLIAYAQAGSDLDIFLVKGIFKASKRDPFYFKGKGKK